MWLIHKWPFLMVTPVSSSHLIVCCLNPHHFATGQSPCLQQKKGWFVHLKIGHPKKKIHWSSFLNPIPTSHLIWVLNCSPHFQNSHGFQSRPLHREPSLPAAVRSHHGTDVESAPGGWGTPWETQLGIFFMVASMDFFHDFFHGKMVV